MEKLGEEECLVALYETPTAQWNQVYFKLNCLEYDTVVDAIDKVFPPKPLSKNWCGTCR